MLGNRFSFCEETLLRVCHPSLPGAITITIIGHPLKSYSAPRPPQAGASGAKVFFPTGVRQPFLFTAGKPRGLSSPGETPSGLGNLTQP